ncbi:MAG: hypothetical protein AAF497_18720 [Planctomycetota bacterium]
MAGRLSFIFLPELVTVIVKVAFRKCQRCDVFRRKLGDSLSSKFVAPALAGMVNPVL